MGALRFDDGEEAFQVSRLPGTPAPPSARGGLGRDAARLRQGGGRGSLSRSRLEPASGAEPGQGQLSLTLASLLSSLIYQSSLGASWAPSVPPAKESFLPTSERSPCTSFPVATSSAGPAWGRSSTACPRRAQPASSPSPARTCCGSTSEGPGLDPRRPVDGRSRSGGPSPLSSGQGPATEGPLLSQGLCLCCLPQCSAAAGSEGEGGAHCSRSSGNRITKP